MHVVSCGQITIIHRQFESAGTIDKTNIFANRYGGISGSKSHFKFASISQNIEFIANDCII